MNPSFSLIRSMVNFLLLFSKDKIRLTLVAFADHTLPFLYTIYRLDSVAAGVWSICSLAYKTLVSPYATEYIVIAISSSHRHCCYLPLLQTVFQTLLMRCQQSSRRISSLERCLSKWHFLCTDLYFEPLC